MATAEVVRRTVGRDGDDRIVGQAVVDTAWRAPSSRNQLAVLPGGRVSQLRDRVRLRLASSLAVAGVALLCIWLGGIWIALLAALAAAAMVVEIRFISSITLTTSTTSATRGYLSLRTKSGA